MTAPHTNAASYEVGYGKPPRPTWKTPPLHRPGCIPTAASGEGMSQQGTSKRTRQETSEARKRWRTERGCPSGKRQPGRRRRDRSSADPTVNACAIRESLQGAKAAPGGCGMTARSGMPVGGMPAFRPMFRLVWRRSVKIENSLLSSLF
jgi:hypothetical protein